MNNEDRFKKKHIPIISTGQLTTIFAEFILWYDEKYCKDIDGAMEVVGEYMTTKTTK